jgi:hypothetical protein
MGYVYGVVFLPQFFIHRVKTRRYLQGTPTAYLYIRQYHRKATTQIAPYSLAPVCNSPKLCTI